MLEEFFWRLFIMGHLLPPRRKAERRPEEAAEEAREGPREGAREGRRPAAEQASTPLGGVGERVGESTPINGAEGSRRGWPASLGWWGWPAAAATASALYAAYHLSVLLLFLPLPYAILGAPASLTRHPPHRAPLPSALSGHFPHRVGRPVCAGELFVFGYGCFLQHLTRKLGVVTSILTHAGGDAVIAFVLADCIWNFLPPLR